MGASFSRSILLLFLLVIVTCIIYPIALWIIGQTLFPFQANGSLLTGSDGKPVGSKLIAQPFSQDEYFQPRPSAASYDASASASSSLAASNYALRDRIARALGPIVTYQDGKAVAPDIEKWFQRDLFQNKPNIVAQWASLHPTLAQAWVSADPSHGAYIDQWKKSHPAVLIAYINQNPQNTKPSAADLATIFFQNFSKEAPGAFPATVSQTISGKTQTTIAVVRSGIEIQSIFFDMWLQDHPDAKLQNIPGDFVTTSGSGLDPHITLQNAKYQLPRVASKWAQKLKRNRDEITQEIEQILQDNASAPFAGFAGEKVVNVLQINLALNKRYSGQ